MFLPLKRYRNKISLLGPKDEEINCASVGSLKSNLFVYSISSLRVLFIAVVSFSLLYFFPNPQNRKINPIIINNAKIIAIIFIALILEITNEVFSVFGLYKLDMTIPVKILLIVKDFNIPIERLDTWVTEAIKVSDTTKQLLNENNFTISRSRVKNLIENKQLKVDGKTVNNPSFKIQNCEIVEIQLPKPSEAIPLPENIKLEILYEDEFIIVINKNSGMVVHPAPGSPNGTLVNALLYHCGENLKGIGGVKRPGIVHRLDKNTSGVMVIAKTELAHANLCKIFFNHDLDRRYNAVVWGQPINNGIIEKPIGRSQLNRKKMAVVDKGKMAVTKWKVLDIFTPFASLIECKLETGRTHQIRVHMSYLGHGIIGDDLYGKPIAQKNFKNLLLKEKNKLIKSFGRQALHASKLCFHHPINNKFLEFYSPLPKDISILIENLNV